MSNENLYDFEDNESGIFMKQDSVYQPVPMTPTQNNARSFLSPQLSNGSPNYTVDENMKRNASFGNLESQTEARVLVMYTGGTIGMLRNEKNGKKSNFDLLFHAWSCDEAHKLLSSHLALHVSTC